jgi:hypothetical protein
MTEYRFHGLPAKKQRTPPIPSVSLSAESHLHGAAVALKHFVELGCDITAPLAHIDLSEADGAKHTLLVEEVIDWLHDPKQAAFVAREGLAPLLTKA